MDPGTRNAISLLTGILGNIRPLLRRKRRRAFPTQGGWAMGGNPPTKSTRRADYKRGRCTPRKWGERRRDSARRNDDVAKFAVQNAGSASYRWSGGVAAVSSQAPWGWLHTYIGCVCIPVGTCEPPVDWASLLVVVSAATSDRLGFAVADIALRGAS